MSRMTREIQITTEAIVFRPLVRELWTIRLIWSHHQMMKGMRKRGRDPHERDG